MTTALVFGASGYLGSRVCEGLRAGGIDTVEAGRSARRGAMHGGFAVDLVTGDPDSVARAVHESGAGLVVNCAGRTIGPTEDLVRLNVLGFARLLSAVEAASTRPRLIHLASAAEYGRTPEGAAVDESAPTRPAGPYGVTKLAATQLLALSRAQGRVDGLALRVFNVLGPDMFHLLNYDRLCANPEREIHALLRFLRLDGHNPDPAPLKEIIAPVSLGRFRNHPDHGFTPDQLGAVRELGFTDTGS